VRRRKIEEGPGGGVSNVQEGVGIRGSRREDAEIGGGKTVGRRAVAL
jgi:hypothetical protein